MENQNIPFVQCVEWFNFLQPIFNFHLSIARPNDLNNVLTIPVFNIFLCPDKEKVATRHFPYFLLINLMPIDGSKSNPSLSLAWTRSAKAYSLFCVYQ